MKLYSANYGTGAGSAYPFEEFELVKVEYPQDIKPDGFLVIWGGADIHPSLYNRRDVASYVGTGPSPRDKIEVALMRRAMELGMPILGVCRGAQLACAMSGGILVQDVSGHGRDHEITTDDGRSIITSSVHHQQMFPWNVEHELKAWASKEISHHYVGLTLAELAHHQKEPEIVWFPHTKMLAVQGHPEFMKADCEFNNYVRELMHAYF